MNRQPPMIDGQRPIAEHVKHLGVHHRRDKIECRIAVGHHRKECDFFISQLFQFQFIVLHHFTDCLNVKWREPCAAAN